MNEIIREFKTKNFTVRVTAEEERDLDLSFDDTGRIRRGLENGTFVAFCAKAAVYFRGTEIATDYLGNCIYKSPAEFMDHHKIRQAQRRAQQREDRKAAKENRQPSQIAIGSYFSDMVRQAISEARKEIEKFKGIKLRA